MKKLSYIISGLLFTIPNSINSQVIADEIAVSTQSESIIEKFTEIRYYFYPNLDAYYDIKTSKFIYKVDDQWIEKETIPDNYRGYSLYNNYRVELQDYNGEKPFEYIKQHAKLYPKDYKGRYLKNKLKSKTESKIATISL